MKKLLVLLTLLVAVVCSFAQVKGTYEVKGADTVKVWKPGAGTTELILDNATHDTLGFLFNKGAGVTEFRRPLKKLNSTTYLVGGDTLSIPNSGTDEKAANLGGALGVFKQKSTDTFQFRTLQSSDTNLLKLNLVGDNIVFSPAPFMDTIYKSGNNLIARKAGVTWSIASPNGKTYTAGQGILLSGGDSSIINARFDLPLWNSSQLQGFGIAITTPQNGDKLIFKDGNWQPSPDSAAIGGSNQQLQYNDSGRFSGAAFKYLENKQSIVLGNIDESSSYGGNFVIGNGTFFDGGSSFNLIIGDSSNSIGTNNVIFVGTGNSGNPANEGNQNIAAIGKHNVIWENNSLVVGQDNQSANGLIVGKDNNTVYDDAGTYATNQTAIGLGLVTGWGKGSAAFGRYNKYTDFTRVGANGPEAASMPIFTVGNGTSNAARSNAFVVTLDGNLIVPKYKNNLAMDSMLVTDQNGMLRQKVMPAADGNNFVSSVGFATNTGLLTLNRQGLGAVTVNLDGRYALAANASPNLTFSAPLTRSLNTISITAANGSTNGYLTSADWNNFNNKAAAFTADNGVGFSGSVLKLGVNPLTAATKIDVAGHSLNITGYPDSLHNGLEIDRTGTTITALDAVGNAGSSYSTLYANTLGFDNVASGFAAGFGNKGTTAEAYWDGGAREAQYNLQTSADSGNVEFTMLSNDFENVAGIAWGGSSKAKRFWLDGNGGTPFIFQLEGLETGTGDRVLYYNTANNHVTVGAIPSGGGGGGSDVYAATPLSRDVDTIKIQAASTSQGGYLTSTDWNTFNNKVATTRTINTTGPLSGGGNLSADRTLSITQANTSTNGYLSSTDWNTFNNKVATSRTISTTGPLTGGGDLSANRTLSITQANGSTAGYLSAADWTTFNNKIDPSGSYSNPTWITALAYSKLTGTPTTIAAAGLTDAVSTGGSYANPSWLTSLDWTKVINTPTTVAGYGITDALGATNSVVMTNKTLGSGTKINISGGTVPKATLWYSSATTGQVAGLNPGSAGQQLTMATDSTLTWAAPPAANQTTLAALRANNTASTTIPYYITDIGQEGFFYYVGTVSDKTSENGGTTGAGTIVVAGTSAPYKQYKRYYANMPLSIRWFGGVDDYTFTTGTLGSGTDNVAAYNRMATAASGNEPMEIPYTSKGWYFAGPINQWTYSKTMNLTIRGNVYVNPVADTAWLRVYGTGGSIKAHKFRNYARIIARETNTPTHSGNNYGVNSPDYRTYTGRAIQLDDLIDGNFELGWIQGFREALRFDGGLTSFSGGQQVKVWFDRFEHNTIGIGMYAPDGTGFLDKNYIFGGMINGDTAIKVDGGFDSVANKTGAFRYNVFHNILVERSNVGIIVGPKADFTYNRFNDLVFEGGNTTGVFGTKISLVSTAGTDKIAFATSFTGKSVIGDNMFADAGVATTITGMPFILPAPSYQFLGATAIGGKNGRMTIIGTDSLTTNSKTVIPSTFDHIAFTNTNKPKVQFANDWRNGELRYVNFAPFTESLVDATATPYTLKVPIGHVRVNRTAAMTVLIDPQELTDGKTFVVDKLNSGTFEIRNSSDNTVKMGTSALSTAIGTYLIVYNSGTGLFEPKALSGGGGGGGTGDMSSNTTTSVDGEFWVANGTTGKSAKRFTGTGFVKAASGVGSTQAGINISDINTTAGTPSASTFLRGDGTWAAAGGGGGGGSYIFSSGLVDDGLGNVTNTLFTGINAANQTTTGSTQSGGDLTLRSTTNATKGLIIFGTSAYDELNQRLGIGTQAPTVSLDVRGNTLINSGATTAFTVTGSTQGGNRTTGAAAAIEARATTNGVVEIARTGTSGEAVTTYSESPTFGSSNKWSTGLASTGNSDFYVWNEVSNTGAIRIYSAASGTTLANDVEMLGRTRLKSGTATAAPLKWSTTNTAVLTPTNGDMEFDNNYLYITAPISGTPTKQALATADNSMTFIRKEWNGVPIMPFYIDGTSNADYVLTTSGTQHGANWTRNEGGFAIYSAVTTQTAAEAIATIALPANRTMEIEVILVGKNNSNTNTYREHRLIGVTTTGSTSATKGNNTIASYTSDFTPANLTMTANGTLNFAVNVSSASTEQVNWTCYIKVRDNITLE